MKKKLFEVGIPIEEVWVFHVEAESKEDVERMIADRNYHTEEWLQVYSLAGSKGFIKEIK
jgi:hypothetical protein